MTSYSAGRRTLAAALVMTALGHQPIVAVPTPFIRLLGDCTAAIFLAQCCFLSEHSADPEGWFERSHEAWRAELDLSPEQIRRCVRDCAGMVEVKRMGLPSRNFYRVLPDGITGRLIGLERPQPVVAQPQAVTSKAESHQPVTSQPQLPVIQQTQQPAVGQAPRHSSIEDVKRHKKPVRDDVRRHSSVGTELLTRLLGVWNSNRGELPEASGLSTLRRKALTVLLDDCAGDVGKASELLIDAVKEVAVDDFWKAKKFGLDTLLPKVLGKAEAYRSRQTATSPKVTTSLPEFGVGQLVTYRRERYAIEAVTDRHIDLWDEENGSARILLNSDDIRAIKPLELRA